MWAYMSRNTNIKPLVCHCGVGCFGSRDFWRLNACGRWTVWKENLTQEPSLYLPQLSHCTKAWPRTQVANVHFLTLSYWHNRLVLSWLLTPTSCSHCVLWPLGVADFRKWAVRLYIQAGRFTGRNAVAFSVPQDGLLLIFVLCTTPWLISHSSCALTYSLSGESNLAGLKMIQVS